MNKEIYRNMRIWENCVCHFRDNIEEEKKYAAGETEICSVNDPFAPFRYESVNERREEIVNQNEHFTKKRQEIAILLAEQGIDVEYVVTGAYPHLKRTVWLHNYCIEESKVENLQKYTYTAYAGIHGSKDSQIFDSLESAVAEILSYYEYMKKGTTVEEAILKFDWKYGKK